jgi:iron complex outermembrane receptor protein
VPAAAWAQPGAAQPLSGRVTDPQGAPLDGVRVVVLELARTFVTTTDGRYRFSSVAPGTYTVSFSRLGRAPETRRVTVAGEGRALDVALRETGVQIAAVQVTATTAATRAQDSPQPTAVVEGAELRASQGAALGETLAEVPGVRSLSMTTGIGKPVIRGMTHYRVVTLDNGQRSETQSWGHDHSPNVETAAAERVEVIKGPASVLYGSDALGGVVNVVAPPVPDALGAAPFARGRAATAYHHNVRGADGTVTVEGAAGGFGARAALTARRSGDMRTPAGPLGNTTNRATAAELAAGTRGAWGTVSARYAGRDERVEISTTPPRARATPASSASPRTARPPRRPSPPAARAWCSTAATSRTSAASSPTPAPLARPRPVRAQLDRVRASCTTRRCARRSGPAAGSARRLGDGERLRQPRQRDAHPRQPHAHGRAVRVRAGRVGALARHGRGALRLAHARHRRRRRHRRPGAAARLRRGDRQRRAPLPRARAGGARGQRRARLPRPGRARPVGQRLPRGDARLRARRPGAPVETSLNTELGVRVNAAALTGELTGLRDARGRLHLPAPVRRRRARVRLAAGHAGRRPAGGAEGRVAYRAAPAVTLELSGDYVRGQNTAARVPLTFIPPLRVVYGVRLDADGRGPCGALSLALGGRRTRGRPASTRADVGPPAYTVTTVGGGFTRLTPRGARSPST